MSEFDEMNLVEKFEVAFKDRKVPYSLSDSHELSNDELEELNTFKNIHWKKVNCSLLQENYEVINWFSPKAFCFFLPGICTAGIKEKKTDLLIYDSILTMLDRTPNPSYWDSFFVKRWALLNSDECSVIEEWLLWLSEKELNSYNKHSFDRALDTLGLLKEGITALR